MKRSTDRILTTHAGGLPRPGGFQDFMLGLPQQRDLGEEEIRAAIAEIVRRQVATGIDVVNDGEMVRNWLNYPRERFSGLERRPLRPEDGPPSASITAREETEFLDYFETVGRGFGGRSVMPGPGQSSAVTNIMGQEAVFCTGPITYTGHAACQGDIDRLKAALQGVDVADACLTGVAPGTIEHWLRNAYYPDDESFLFAIADALNQEFRMITSAGVILQVDDPDLPDGWQVYPQMTVPEYRQFAELRVEAINRALAGIPEEMVRLHICWGSLHGPHKHDLPLREFVDIVLKVKAQGYSIEASNPRHEHEWSLWRDVRLPEGKILIPGVVGHFSDFIEHPELVAQRLVRYAECVGRENVIAGTDCGLGSRVGHPSIVWAKFEAMAEGAVLASRRLWGR